MSTEPHTWQAVTRQLPKLDWPQSQGDLLVARIAPEFEWAVSRAEYAARRQAEKEQADAEVRLLGKCVAGEATGYGAADAVVKANLTAEALKASASPALLARCWAAVAGPDAGPVPEHTPDHGHVVPHQAARALREEAAA